MHLNLDGCLRTYRRENLRLYALVLMKQEFNLQQVFIARSLLQNDVR